MCTTCGCGTDSNHHHHHHGHEGDAVKLEKAILESISKYIALNFIDGNPNIINNNKSYNEIYKLQKDFINEHKN